MERAPLTSIALDYGCSTSDLISRYASAPRVDWTTPGLKIVRLRLLTDRFHPWWDVSYCWGEISGKPVQVVLPFSQLPKVKGYGLIPWLQAARLNGHRLGIWAALSNLR